MGDENHIRTLGDYSKPSHAGYRNTIELPVGNNVVPLRSDTIRLMQNECPFHGLWSEDPNQHLKDFLKLVDLLNLDGSITTWEDLTTRFLAQLFPPRRTAKLRNDILMFQQHHGESLSEAWTRRTIDQSADGKLRDHNAKETWALLEDLTLYDNESWNDPRDFAKPVKYCMEDPEQAFVEYASSRTDEAGEGLVSEFMASQDARLSKFEADFKQQQSEMTNKIDTMLKAITDQIAGTLPSDTVKNPKLGTYLVSFARFYPKMDLQCSTQIYSSIIAITIHPKQQSDSHDKTEVNKEEERGNPETILTLLHHPTHQFHSSQKKSSNSIRTLNRSNWFPHRPTMNSFAPKKKMAT
ncbi:zinc finger, CCHC-type containing protein [Tanacetum coccineum]